jgi:Protein of unknown function (DUF3617)
MNRAGRVSLFGALAISLAVIAAAQAPALKINLGAWEVAMAVDMAGQMPGDTSKLTPEQQAAIDAMAKARGNQPSRTRKTCVTKENFQKGTFLDNDDADMKCTRTLAANTATAIDQTITCTGDNASRTSHLRIDASSPTNFTARATTTSTRNNRTMTVNATMTGKWLGTDCTGIKKN